MGHKSRIKSMLGFILRISGLPCFIREVLLKDKNTILCYHNPDSGLLRAHLAYLVKRYKIIALDTLVDAIKTKDWSSLPSKSLVITFDDGLKENYDLLTVIRDFNVPVTIYLCSHIVTTKRRYWFLSGSADVQRLKTVPNHDRLSVLKEKLGFEQEKEYAEAQTLDLAQLKEMSGYVDFQSHSRFHPVLTQCQDKECMEEIKGSKQYLEGIFNRKLTHFAYPNGDYGAREMGFLKQSDYKSGVSMKFGWNDQNSDPYCLKRFGVADDASVDELIGEISGIFGNFRKFWKMMMGEE